MNSAFFTQGQKPTDRIVSNSGATTVSASSFYWTQPACAGPACVVTGMGFWTRGSATVAIQTSAVGAAAAFADSGPVLFGDTSKFSSDDRSWVQQTANQSNADLKTILPKVMTSYPGLPPQPTSCFWIDPLTPMLGTVTKPGVLIDAVSDAACPAGANALPNPIDNSCTTEDVLGNPRVDAGNSTRSIGAIQNVQSPFLTVGDVDATSVQVSWNRPVDPASGPSPATRCTSPRQPAAPSSPPTSPSATPCR